MRVFVSYSFKDSELHLLTLLISKLKEEGHYIETSDTYYNDYINYDDRKIIKSDLFVGIITNDSQSIDEVIREWDIANKNRIESILVIEEDVEVEDESINYIKFNRSNPNKAIKILFGEQEKREITKNKDGFGSKIIGTAAIFVGVAAIIALLAGGGKNK